MDIKLIQNVYRSLDVTAAVLLLTGQISISGVFITTGAGFSLSLSGPITGGMRTVSHTTKTNQVIDSIDAIAAILLILDQINVIGTFISAHRFTLVVTGPVFGEKKRVAYSPKTQKIFSDYQSLIMKKFHITPRKWRKQ